ncbi:SDR family oxidoreductase [Georgenia sp. Z1491]|uniref:SDR family oxidoreductase n=1 Tax=Georgenia sp. Z1491 TaxID=3416707 RepID=UPI003CEA4C32
MTGRNVLVTGGASGIGAAVVDRFLALGDRVTILDRTQGSTDAVEAVTGDVRSAADNLAAVVAAAPDGRLDVLVANAGVHDGGRRLTDGSIDEFDRWFRAVLEVNVIGYALALKAASGPLVAARGAAVLTLSDAAFDVRGNGSGLAYPTSKHALLGLCRAAARDLAPHARVNAVAPGGVPTRLSDGAGEASRPLIDDAGALEQRLRERTLMARGTTLEEIADAYVYLASASAGSITGQVLRVDGGLIP